MALIAPLTTSYLGAFSPRVAIRSCLPNTFSTPKLLPTPGGPDTIIALTSPFLDALVMSSNMSNRSRSRSITSSSVSSLWVVLTLLSTVSKLSSSGTMILMLRSGKPLTSLASTVMNEPFVPHLKPSTSGNTIPARSTSLPLILYVPFIIFTFCILPSFVVLNYTMII